MDLSDARQRYVAWLGDLKRHGLSRAEHLLPTIETPCPRDLPALMARGAPLAAQDDAVLRGQINALRPWGYGIQLREGVVTESNPVALERMIYRSHLISGSVRTLLGDDYGSSTFLDMACNHGYFALEAGFLGARRALGVDLRPQNIAKASFLKDSFSVPNVEFRVGNVYDLDLSQRFDVVYNLGLLYHVTDPYLLMRRTYDLCNRIAVVDSIMHKEPVSAFLQMVNKDTASHAEGDFVVELHPTYRATIDLMHAVGFREIREVVPSRSAGQVPHALYDRFDRRCLIGFK
jgi:SAM-dependent methyltransferase